jgi:hypothetical protein
MSTSESAKLDLHESLIWEQGLRLFALTSLSEGNPFRKEIEEQTSRSVEELLRMSAVTNSTDIGV